MDWITLAAIHDRIRAAQLPGYSLHYSDGSDQFYMVIYGDNERVFESREHSASVLLDWADAILSGIGA